MNNENSGVNTVLIVILIVIVVGGLVWFFSANRGVSAPTQDETSDFKVDVSLPSGDDGGPASSN